MCAPPPTHAAAHARPDAAHRDGLTLTIRNVIRLQALENVHTYTINTLKLNDTDYVYYHMVNIQTTAVANSQVGKVIKVIRLLTDGEERPEEGADQRRIIASKHAWPTTSQNRTE